MVTPDNKPLDRSGIFYLPGRRSHSPVVAQGGRLRGRIVDEFDSAPMRTLLLDPGSLRAMPGAEVLKDDRRSTVVRGTVDGRGVVLKQNHARSVFKNLKRAFAPSRAARAWYGAHTMESLGVDTAAPIGYLERRYGPFRGHSWVILEDLGGVDALRYLADPAIAPEERVRVVEAIVGIYLRLHRARVTHGDNRLQNFLIVEGRPHIIDLDVAVVHPWWSPQFRRYARRDLERLTARWQGDPELARAVHRTLAPRVGGPGMNADRGTVCVRTERVAGGHLLWPATGDRPPPEWCDPHSLPPEARVRGGGTGRGTTVCFEVDGRTLVLRHYRRGGMARWLGDRYLRLGLRRSRAWRELALLVHTHALGLPVPPPVGARVEPLAPWSPFCRSVLLTEYLPGTQTLAEALRRGPLAGPDWTRIGALIARFHAAGVDHADLNAHNLLLDDADRAYLIDFDRGRLRPPGGRWRERNLARLRRSLDKLAGQEPSFAFAEADWTALLRGYRGERGRAAT